MFCNSCFGIQHTNIFKNRHRLNHLPTICLWVFLKCFIKSTIAFTSTAEVLHESTGAHVRKGGVASNEKNCIKLNAKKKK